MASMNHGGAFVGGGAQRRSPMYVYDFLPPKIRELIANAPYDYATENIARKIKEEGADTIERRMRELLAVAIKQNAAAAYGPDHPQAQ